MAGAAGRNGTVWPVELTAPDISAYRNGNTGIDYVTSFDSGRAGPHVMVVGLTHGNELCGAIAIDWLFRREVRPEIGRLSLVLANYAAYDRFDPSDPTSSRFVDEDLNRVWDVERLDGTGDTWELRRARALRPMVETVDLLLDLHSMQQPNPPLMLAGPLEKGRELARALRHPEVVMCDAGHAAGRRLRDYGVFSDPDAPQNALLLEAGQHWTTGTETVAIENTVRFLRHTGVVVRDFGQEAVITSDVEPRIVEVVQPVTVKTSNFRFVHPYIGMEIIPEAGTVIAWDGDQPVATPHEDCVLIMPNLRLQPGQTAVRLGRYL